MSAYRRLVRRLVDSPGLVTVGHYGVPPLLALALAMRVVLVETGSYLACYAVGAFMIPFMVAVLAHHSGICARGGCAVLMAPNPTEVAGRYRWWLHHVHAMYRSLFTWATVAAWAVITFVLASPVLSWFPIVALVVVELRAVTLHSRLRPWCPECNGRGPDDDEAPEPDPPGGLAREPEREAVR